MAAKLARIPVPMAARKGKVWPRGPVDQTIGEPAEIVGEKSGKVYATLAERRPENLKIMPIRGRDVRKYAAGGMVGVRGYAGGGLVSDVAGVNAADSAAAAGDTQQQQQANQNVFNAKNSQQGVDQSAYQAELSNAQKQQADEQAVANAAKNTPDLEAAAQAQTTQNTEDQMYSALGVSKPADVAVAPGGAATSGSPLARTQIQSQMEVNAAQASRDRAISYANSRVNSAQMGLAGVGTQGAELGLSQADYAAKLKQQQLDQSKVSAENNQRTDEAAYTQQERDYTATQRAKAAADANLPVGMTRDPETNQIVSFDELRQRQAARGAVYDPSTRSYTTQADLKSRTDAFGNVARPDGTLVSPQGNELRTDPTTGKKQWTDPLTGNVLVNPTTWQDKSGNQFHITNDKTGAGYWESPGGFVLGADGIWENKATGEQIIDGVRYSPQRTTRNSAPSINVDAAGAPPVDAGTQYDENGDPITP